jgi:hypothetical protein
MKRILILTFLTLLLSFSAVSAVNVVEIQPIATVPNTVSPATVTANFDWTNDQLLQGVSNGYKVYVTGPATAAWVDASGVAYNDLVGAMVWFYTYTQIDSLPSLILFGGAYMPGVFDGVPIGGPRLAHSFDVTLTFTGGALDDAQVCIDTAFFPPAGGWVWDPGGTPPVNLNPQFNGGVPYCFQYEYIPCQPPAFVAPFPPGDILSLDHCIGGDFQFTAIPVEPGKVITGYGIVSDPSGLGAIDGAGLFTYSVGVPGVPGDYPVSIECYNDCPGTSNPYDFIVRLTNVGLQYINCPVGVQQVSQGKVFCWDLGLDNFDCDVITEGYTATYVGPGTGTPDGVITIVGGLFCFNTTSNDVGVWTFTVTGNDGNGETAVCIFDLEVTATSTFGVRIAKIGEIPNFVFQGHYATLPIYLDYMGTDPIGGFDFLIAYDASALTFINAERGAAIDCWEYFQYRNGPFGNCQGMCPTGMLRVVAMAEANDGPNHPSGCDGDDGLFTTPDAELVKIKFYVTDDRTYECQYVPVYFYWLDCGDNAISNWTGETLYISNHVYNINWVDINNDYYELIPNDGSIDENDHVYGAFHWCDDPNPLFPNKPVPIKDIDFFNGGVDIACANDIDARGDLNLNNLANEIADAVLYTNYFIYGPPVFNINLEGQIAASDVNNDGRVLTVGDLVYLVRILTGDATPFTKLSPFAHEATVRVSGDVVSISSPVDVGAVLFVFDGEATVDNLSNMDMLADVVDGQTRVLVYNIGTNSVAAGTSELVRVNGGTLVEAEVVDYNGNDLTTNLVAKIVPKAYALLQNYPNPFNPTTEVALELPEASNWNIDVYNVAGQLVKSYSGYSDAGVVKVNVDASGWASGIYFYKAVANNFVATKKMVLMK